MSSVPALATSTPTENLAGLFERVTFHNEENVIGPHWVVRYEC